MLGALTLLEPVGAGEAPAHRPSFPSGGRSKRVWGLPGLRAARPSPPPHPQELGNSLDKCKNNENLQQILTNATIMVVSVTASTTQGCVGRGEGRRRWAQLAAGAIPGSQWHRCRSRGTVHFGASQAAGWARGPP